MPQAAEPKNKLTTGQPYLNLGLNDGTYMPEACIEVLRRLSHRTGLRHYTTPGNNKLRDVISRVDGVTPDHIFLHNGSGPILKAVIPALIKDRVMARPYRIALHLLQKSGYPIITTAPTYGKVTAKAMAMGLGVELVPLRPENNFTLDPEDLAKVIARRAGLVYIGNPNNPTGNLMLKREDVAALADRFPESTFWVDEAYVQYAPPDPHPSVSDLVPKMPNLCVSRTFSFAYGLAGVRIGYLLANPDLVRSHEDKLTDYRLGILQEQIAVAALEDTAHLPYIREVSAEGRAQLEAGLSRYPIQVFPSVANFILCRFTDGRPAAPLIAGLEERGIHIKSIEPMGPHRFDEYFRITLGLPHEHERLLASVAEILG